MASRLHPNPPNAGQPNPYGGRDGPDPWQGDYSERRLAWEHFEFLAGRRRWDDDPARIAQRREFLEESNQRYKRNKRKHERQKAIGGRLAWVGANVLTAGLVNLVEDAPDFSAPDLPDFDFDVPNLRNLRARAPDLPDFDVPNLRPRVPDFDFDAPEWRPAAGEAADQRTVNRPAATVLKDTRAWWVIGLVGAFFIIQTAGR